jgi:hypothetical protein
MVEQREGVENICCPYLKIVNCADTEEHKHLLCEHMRQPIPNHRITTWCVSNHKWRQCVIYPGDPA